MSYDFKLPDIGEGVVEGEIVEWLVKEGDVVKEDQPLVAVMTDKATVEIPSPKGGRVAKLGGQVGQTIKVGSLLVSLDTGNGKMTAAEKPAPAAQMPAARPERAAPAAKAEAPIPRKAESAGAATAQAVREQEIPAAAKAPVVAERAPAAKADRPSAARPAERRASEPTGEHVLASPATRKLAREMGVDLASVQGSGPGGRVSAEDVEAAAAAPKRARLAVAAPFAEGKAASQAARVEPETLLAIPRRAEAPAEHVEERVAVRGLRKKIAERMAQSKRTAAHFAYVDECDVSELVKLRTRLKPVAAKYGVNLTYLPFILKALVPCLREFPLMNATFDEQAGELVLKRYYNIGVATDTENGLTVPVVKDVDRKSVLEIAAELTELTERARAGRTKMEDISGGTFTVTSTGNIGGLFATPIINYPEVAILGVPKIKPRPWIVGDKVEVREVLYLALSLDHRVVDGAVAARFMNALIEYVTDPGKIFLELA